MMSSDRRLAISVWRAVVALALAVPVSLAGLIAVGMLGHGNRGMFLVAAWLLAPLPTIAYLLDLPDAAAIVLVFWQWILWAFLIERGIALVSRSRPRV